MASIVIALLLAQSAEDLYRRGLLLLRSNDAPEAAVVLERAAELDPANPIVWMAVADARLRLGKLEEALRAEAHAARLGDSDAVVRKVRAMFHARFARATTDRKAAVTHLKLAGSFDPERENYAIDHVQLLLDSRVEREAEAEATALRRFPKSAELHRLLGISLYAQGRNADAIDSFLRAVDLAPDNETHYASLEPLLADAGTRMPAIIKRLDCFSQRHPKSPLAPYLRAMSTREESERLLRRAMNLDPAFWSAYFELQKHETDPRERIRLLQKVVELNAEYAPAYYALAEVYAAIGDREAARTAREQHHRLARKSY